MTTSTETHTTEQIEVAGRRVQYLQGGSGDPVLVLHHSIGNPGWLPVYERLAASRQVLVPDLPGYGQSERPEWAREPRDIAILLLQMLGKLGVGSVPVVGLGFGGWIAAEMATMDQQRVSSLVLVGAPGIQPDEGEILDQMLIDYHEYVQAGFSSAESYQAEFGEDPAPEIRELWDFSREMTARLTWKPYMFNRRLPPLLEEVQTPTLLVWGADDAIVPMAVAQAYAAALPNASIEVVADCGHFVDIEQPDRLAELAAAHIG
ncbi:MAG: alpha/beta hydrolase [Chloroflexi bacterium]|nr:alpha/beta hydrolase [Chloroflexota bacterium]MYE47106.1 alpha/beta hydrolase [Chloroflexota bacterium]